MIKIFRGGDIKLPVSSISGLGDKYKIYFYTKHADVYFSKTDQDVVSGTQPYIPLNWSDLSQIGDGVLNLRVNTYTVNMAYDDEVYDNTFTRTTNYYIVNEENPQDDPKSLTERVEELEVGLAEEVERSVTFDDNTTNLINTLSEDLEDEETAREAADTALQNNLNTVNDGLNETIVQLTNEITNRQQADNQLSMSIMSEAQQRQLGDSNLQTAIDANASAISNIGDELELYALKADVYNKTQIDSKVTEIYGSIGSEESSRIAGDENLQVQINSKANSSDVYSKTHIDNALATKADKSTTYTKSEVDASLATKANSADVYGKNEVYTKSETDAAINAHTPDLSNYYTKSETDTALSGKADTATTLAGYGITDAYTKTAVDTALSGKADASTTYSKTEVDTALSAKANSADVYTKTQIDTTLSSYETIANHNADVATLNTAIGTKANSADVYTKSEVYTKAEAVSQSQYSADMTSLYNDISDNELVVASALNDLNERVGEIDLTDYYDITAVDTLLSAKANQSTTYTKSEVDTALAGKASTATTIAGYGITDAYTKTEVDAMIGNINTILASI